MYSNKRFDAYSSMCLLLVQALLLASAGLLAAGDGAKCLLDCIREQHSGNTLDNVRQFHLYLMVSNSAVVNRGCQFMERAIGCASRCPRNNASDVFMPTFEEIESKYCGNQSDNEATKKFWQDFVQLSRQWGQKIVDDSCLTCNETDVNSECAIWSSCLFGKALDAVKDGYAEDVVALLVNSLKFFIALVLDKQAGDHLPQSCDFLYQPYGRNDRALV